MGIITVLGILISILVILFVLSLLMPSTEEPEEEEVGTGEREESEE